MHQFQTFEIQLIPGRGPGNRIFIDGRELRDWYMVDVHKEVDELSRVEIGFYAQGRISGSGDTNLHQQELHDLLVGIAEQWNCPPKSRIMRGDQ